MITLLFFCSGATALVYEVVWSKYLSVLLGSTIYAQSIVLASFMGGLAAGNRIFGGVADRCARPLRMYGMIELAIGIYALAFPLLDIASGSLFEWLGSKVADSTPALVGLKGVSSVALLLVPTILMGGTLPLIASWLNTQVADPERRTSVFYAVNSFGAVVGAWLAGFLLVRKLGLDQTLYLVGSLNLAIGLAAIGMSTTRDIPQPASRDRANEDRGRIGTGILLLVAVVGGASMAFEVLASRSLSLIFGSSLQVFAVVLIVFILGIAGGSSVVASRIGRKLNPHLASCFFVALAAAFAFGIVTKLGPIVNFYIMCSTGISRTEVGYIFHQLLTGFAALGFIGLPAACLGAILPLWIRHISEPGNRLGSSVGRLLTWNTIGAVLGALIAGFFLMPTFGLRNSFAIIGAALLLVGIVIAWISRRRAIVVVIGLGACAVVTHVARQHADWKTILSSGVFRVADAHFSLDAYLRHRKAVTKLLFYEDASDATVSVESAATGLEQKEVVLRVNGKPDATAFGDFPTQVLLAHLPLMVRPDSAEVFCFGLGSGITAGSALGYPIRRLTVAENCKPVLRAAQFFSPWNNGVLTNAKVRLLFEDARTVLRIRHELYDVIIAEPSNPWMSGVGSVFTREFYELAASRLKPDGIMSQWFHLYEMDDATVEVVIRTFCSVFPFVEIWDVGDEDIVLLGSKSPWDTSPEKFQRVFDLPKPREDLHAVGLNSADAILARQFASQLTASAIAGGGVLQSDNHPVLEYAAPKAFYVYHNQRGVNRFQKFDERTWQQDLAPTNKNAVLRGLPISELQKIFGRAGSANPELRRYLTARFQGEEGSLVFGNQVMRSSLSGTNGGVLIYAPPSGVTNAMVRQLYFAEVMLWSEPGKREEALAQMHAALVEVKEYDAGKADWSAEYYCDLMAKSYLRLGQMDKAKAALKMGLRLEPESPQLAYLSRVILQTNNLDSEN